ncbi:DUF2306 domain-containing protein [Terrimonas sp. NA20]|uniref:DUF2306 domain-containing protein n=1 Tax=Terrimonas ginsenosidimutans TaxID=2908004 RepID=A0ABS9KTI7_9BACT|nr:DUF2306 domain-containing protein [Terrimonas ginsenosidimutans]MCG2615634.1 DUF2306 domain-containing protein [Terrimonas ginsenosidimutans]
MKQTPAATRIFQYSARFWFTVTYLGQLIFAYYILMLYWTSTALGEFENWNKVNPHFYRKDDLTGNIFFASHVVLAAIVTILGPLQLVNGIRSKWPRLHRVCGRIYIYSAFLISAAGLYLALVRGAVGGPFSTATVSINGAIIMLCAFFCVRYARQRNIPLHNRWAIHLLIAMSGVWFFRVFFMLWMVIFRAPVGFDPETFTGPFLYVLDVFVYIFPQAIVVLYFKAKFSAGSFKKYLFSCLLLIITLATAVGIFGAAGGMWLPKL